MEKAGNSNCDDCIFFYRKISNHRFKYRCFSCRVTLKPVNKISPVSLKLSLHTGEAELCWGAVREYLLLLWAEPTSGRAPCVQG